MVQLEISLTRIFGIILAGKRNYGSEGKGIRLEILSTSMGRGRIILCALHYL